VSDYATYWVVSGGKSNQVENGPHLDITEARIAREKVLRELAGRLHAELQIEVREAGQ
jgi:hypothetical protein